MSSSQLTRLPSEVSSMPFPLQFWPFHDPEVEAATAWPGWTLGSPEGSPEGSSCHRLHPKCRDLPFAEARPPWQTLQPQPQLCIVSGHVQGSSKSRTTC